MTDQQLFMIEWSSKAAVTIALATLAVRMARRRSAAVRNAIWRVALVAVVALPLAMALLPHFNAKVSLPAPVTPEAAPVRSAPSEPATSSPVVVATEPLASVPAAVPERVTAPDALVILYALGLVLAAGRWWIGFSRIRRIARNAGPFEPANHRSIAAVLIASEGTLSVPVTFGLFKPLILLPAEAAQWPGDRILAALLHEEAHIWRRDWAWQTAAAATEMLHWFNPAMWLMSHGLRKAAEESADDEVLNGGLVPSVYARQLLSVAEAAQGRTVTAMAMARRGGVSDRLRRILAPGLDRRSPRPRLVAGIAALFATIGSMVAGCSIVQARDGDDFRPNREASTSAPQTEAPVFQQALPHGAKARVVLLTDLPAWNRSSWRPDGSPVTASDLQVTDTIEPTSPAPQGSQRPVNLLFEVVGVPDRDPAVYTYVGQQQGFGTGMFDPETHRYVQSAGFNVTPIQKTLDVRLGLASAPLRVIAQGRLGLGPLEAVATQRPAVESAATNKLTGRFHVVVTKTDPEQCTVRVLIPPDAEGMDLHLEAYDAKGRPFPKGGYPSVSKFDRTTGIGSRSYDFVVKSPDQIAQVKLLGREIDWVTLKGIHLRRNP
jgi:beta-lactamase regulating signal transducer with metallopeptidase domain